MSDERYVEDSGEKFEPDRSAPRAPMAGLPVANPERTKAEERAEQNKYARAEAQDRIPVIDMFPDAAPKTAVNAYGTRIILDGYAPAVHGGDEPIDNAGMAKVMNTVDAKTGKDYVRPPSSHYSTGGVEPWDLIHDAKLNFDEGCIVKYVCRHRRKDGVIDLRKAMSYLKALAMDVYGEEL